MSFLAIFCPRDSLFSVFSCSSEETLFDLTKMSFHSEPNPNLSFFLCQEQTTTCSFFNASPSFLAFFFGAIVCSVRLRVYVSTVLCCSTKIQDRARRATGPIAHLFHRSFPLQTHRLLLKERKAKTNDQRPKTKKKKRAFIFSWGI